MVALSLVTSVVSSMVYPDDYTASTEGGRDVIDGNSDASLPYILLVRHGSSDHIQPNFPTPGQIRSMFNTGKISECPEYASSPSTMSDPLEWRPSNQVEMIEERLMRIHHWNDSTSFMNRNYEGSVALTELNRTTSYASSTENNSSVVESPMREQEYNYVNNQRVELGDNDCETHSETSGQSERLVEETDVDCNHREYDVEEYVEQVNNLADASENSMIVYSSDFLNEEDSKMIKDSLDKLKEVDLESSERQKQIEKVFNLTVQESDNEFISDLKNLLLEKIRNHFFQENKNECTLSEDVRKVTDIINRTIADKDSVICDNVHELCLRLRDILVLKDEILKNPMLGNLSAGDDQDFRPDLCNKDKTILKSNVTASLHHSQCYTEKEFNNEKVSDEKVTMIHSYNKGSELKIEETNNIQKDSYESLVKFSRIPIPKSKLQKTYGGIQSRNNHKVTVSKMPTTNVTKHVNIKQDHLIDHRENYGHMNKRVNSRHTRDILQQKDEIIKKAAVLGLIDGVNDMAKIPYLTERAQLALLEKQIQGKLKSRQLALERKKTGLRDRISNLKLNSDSTETVNKPAHKLSNIVTVSTKDIVDENVNIKNYEETTENETITKIETDCKTLALPERIVDEEIMSQIEESKSKETIVSENNNQLNDEQSNICLSEVDAENNQMLDTYIDELPTTSNDVVSELLEKSNQDNVDLIIEEVEYENISEDDSASINFYENELPLSRFSSVMELIPEKTNLPEVVSSTSQSYDRVYQKMYVYGVFLPIVIFTVAVCLMPYVYQNELLVLYNQWSFTLYQLWQHALQYEFNWKELFEDNFVEVKKYVKIKCEEL